MELNILFLYMHVHDGSTTASSACKYCSPFEHARKNVDATQEFAFVNSSECDNMHSGIVQHVPEPSCTPELVYGELQQQIHPVCWDLSPLVLQHLQMTEIRNHHQDQDQV